ncbi:chemotaxis protein CheW [Oscillatoria sp. CS-180]|uniref:chemotaxis protein CheW n=1 Tax=Oscillatoria sp. CS-180 TaxID=3021720 RepID=UPI00232C0D5E|nr:chemotaxis protein CheW [Oscillatoria sp. CS-180]MDB9528784.1 chemotaxis protein CheW [Oscillatoria sp. CS-180]
MSDAAIAKNSSTTDPSPSFLNNAASAGTQELHQPAIELPIAESPSIQGDQYLQVRLADLPQLLLPISDLAELTKLTLNDVVPIFQMPAWVIGVYNWRGEMLWTIDLNHFLGLTPWYQQRDRAAKHTMVIIQPAQDSPSPEDTNVVLGLVVNEVASIVTYPEGSLQSMPQAAAIAASVQPFLKGVCANETGELDWVLDSQAILAVTTQARV